MDDAGIFLNSQHKFKCGCGNEYKYRQGLWKHRNVCKIKFNAEKSPNNENLFDTNLNKELVLTLVQQNSEFKELIVEQAKEYQKQIIELTKNSSVINNTNNFNLNVFLNEKCSNAMNIMDFVNSLKLQLDDLDNTANIGYVNGISKIFLRGLNELDVYERPIHCSDLKRETLYIKDNNIWEKDEDKKKVKKAIQNITHKNLKQLNDWIKKNPDANNIQTKKHEEYIKILIKCTGGINDEENDKFFNKIIKNLTKEVLINKK
uniref:C2H2-type domain-containing protein n=1 Tax=viral metagenome TaxID=1070528 RepID=A0A6C0KY19_9ZZZZ